jgi:hypothetical protein
MIVGTHSAVNKAAVVMSAARDLDLLIKVKRERMRQRDFRPINGIPSAIEQIIFENDRDCALDSANARRVGRRLYWPERYPVLAETTDGELIFTQPLQLPLPPIPDPTHYVNPYNTDVRGHSDWKPGDKVNESRKMPQRLEEIASAKHRNFLVFHPVAQIVLVSALRGQMIFSTLGSHRTPLSTLTGYDDRKIA